MPVPPAVRTLSAAALLTCLLVPLGGTTASARAVGAPAPLAAVTGQQVRITEGQVRETGPGGSILYPSVTSCLTVTVRLKDGGLVGAHISLFRVPGEYRSDEILPVLRRTVGERRVRAVEVKGAVGAWHPGYLTKAVEAYGPDEEVPVPTGPDPDGIAGAVARGLAVPRGRVSVQDLPDGDLTVR
ncbi:hypothetical protein AB0K09_16615 [Streptomyces sp. NPDC049577]|uniref:hypothetical protein n=1 Tax=Streptomyces sp. NPDC049577 TaxID=3155153 RepID=UPI00343A9F97